MPWPVGLPDPTTYRVKWCHRAQYDGKPVDAVWCHAHQVVHIDAAVFRRMLDDAVNDLACRHHDGNGTGYSASSDRGV